MERKTTDATRKAIYKYDNKFERVNCRFATGTKDRILFTLLLFYS